jgi:hypothetical protein
VAWAELVVDHAQGLLGVPDAGVRDVWGWGVDEIGGGAVGAGIWWWVNLNGEAIWDSQGASSQGFGWRK